MEFLVVISPSHRVLYQQHFLPGLPSDVQVRECSIKSTGEGRYLSGGWQDGVIAKLEFALQFCQEHPGSLFVVSDVDIQFFPEFTIDVLRLEFEASGADVLFQKETASELSQEVNTGFYIARATPWMGSLLEHAIKNAADAVVRNDQTLINDLLPPAEAGKTWSYLRSAYYARSHGFPPPSGVVLHHANVTSSVEEKISQLQRVRTYVSGGWFGRFIALVGEVVSYMQQGKLSAMLARRMRGNHPPAR